MSEALLLAFLDPPRDVKPSDSSLFGALCCSNKHDESKCAVRPVTGKTHNSFWRDPWWSIQGAPNNETCEQRETYPRLTHTRTHTHTHTHTNSPEIEGSLGAQFHQQLPPETRVLQHPGRDHLQHGRRAGSRGALLGHRDGR